MARFKVTIKYLNKYNDYTRHFYNTVVSAETEKDAIVQAVHDFDGENIESVRATNVIYL